MGLTEFYKIKAEEELGENETRKSQSLEQFRDWITKQPHIKNCRLDDSFLLRFLRARKYSFINATKTLESYLTSMTIFPQYFENLDIRDPVMANLLDTGYFLSLPNRTKDGERIMILRLQAFDLEKFTGDDSYRISILGLKSIFEEEETQISGLKFIFDFSNLSMGYYGKFKISDHKNLGEMVRYGLPLRAKSISFFNMPGFASSIVQFIVSFLGEKLRNRIKLFKTLEDLKSDFDVDLLPEEYGGKIPISEVITYMKETFLERRSIILRTCETEFTVKTIPDWASCYEIESGIEGNFRNLKID